MNTATIIWLFVLGIFLGALAVVLFRIWRPSARIQNAIAAPLLFAFLAVPIINDGWSGLRYSLWLLALTVVLGLFAIGIRAAFRRVRDDRSHEK